jgi:peptidoglycan/LPS O-acetylase OafA/YrhL
MIGPVGHDVMGRMGVMFFFVHTSLVLLRSLDRMPLEGWKLMEYFYVRRAFRIYPLSILVVCLMVVLRLPPMPNGLYTPVSLKTLLANLALVQNIVAVPDVLGPLWSLPWEVQMYIALPVIFMVITHSRMRGTVWWLWTGTFLVRMLGLAFHLRPLSILGYAPCFLAGAIAWRARQRSAQRLNGSLLPAGIILAGAVYALLRASVRHDGIFVAAYVSCLILGVTLPLFRELPESTITLGAHYIAKYSYGIYLAHVPLMWVTRNVLSTTPGIVRWGFLSITSILIPALLFHFVEDPLIRIGGRLAASIAEGAPSRAVSVSVTASGSRATIASAIRQVFTSAAKFSTVFFTRALGQRRRS